MGAHGIKTTTVPTYWTIFLVLALMGLTLFAGWKLSTTGAEGSSYPIEWILGILAAFGIIMALLVVMGKLNIRVGLKRLRG